MEYIGASSTTSRMNQPSHFWAGFLEIGKDLGGSRVVRIRTWLDEVDVISSSWPHEKLTGGFFTQQDLPTTALSVSDDIKSLLEFSISFCNHGSGIMVDNRRENG